MPLVSLAADGRSFVSRNERLLAFHGGNLLRHHSSLDLVEVATAQILGNDKRQRITTPIPRLCNRFDPSADACAVEADDRQAR